MFDAIILGLGAMGSAAAYHLTRTGKKVLGIDRFAPPHTFGSSHGETRIIREAYFEHESYVPLVRRAYELWRDLEQHAGRSLLVRTGGVMIGPPDGVLVSGAERSAKVHGLAYEMLSTAALRRRFPQLAPDEGMAGVWEPRAGVLFPEACIEAHLGFARSNGAELLFDAPARWQPEAGGVKVFADGREFTADQLVISAGAWTSELLPDLRLPLEVERQVAFWFAPKQPEQFRHESCPVHIWEYGPDTFFYGLPDFGGGIKVARHHKGELTQPEAVRRDISEEEVMEMRRLVARYLPGGNGAFERASVCLYTNTTDQHFLIDRHPYLGQVWLVSACSGHGFKFSSVVGEIISSFVNAKRPPFDLSRFRYRP